MGVKTLWTILSGVGELTDLRELQGKRVAVDTAGWIVESNLCRGISGKVNRPHLRNVFFRAAALHALNIYPVFVFDGEAPALKKETLQKRRAAEQGSVQSRSQTQPDEPIKLSRNRLKSVMGECRALLQALGFECVSSSGEAESLCSQLNFSGQVDAIISEDSDTFCYGAITVLRNFSIVATGSSVEMYSMEKIGNLLSLTRDRLIIMAVLLGCDFYPSGVPGIGKEMILKLFSIWPVHWNSINAFQIWSQQGFPFEDKKSKKGLIYECYQCSQISEYASNSVHCISCIEWMEKVSKGDCRCELLSGNSELFKIENSIRKKCSGVEASWWNTEFEKILKEFLTTQSIQNLRKTSESQQPNFDLCVSLLVKKLSWTEEYAVEKMIPLLTRWHVRNTPGDFALRVIQPLMLKKKRVKNGNPCFDVIWKSQDENCKYLPKEFESCEPAHYIKNSYPDLLIKFEENLASKKKPVKTRKAAKTSTAATQEQQQPITNFFAQGKMKGQLKGTKGITSSDDPKRHQPEVLTEKVFESNSFAPSANPSSFLQHRDLLRTRNSVLSEMSVDISCDSLDSDLSMIIDDFLNKGATERPQVFPQKFIPITSTPHVKNKRDPVVPKTFQENISSSLMDKVAGDLSRMSVSEFEDTFDRMCK